MRNILFRTGLIVSLFVFVSMPAFAQMKIGDSPTSITTGAQLDIEKSGSRTVFMDTGKVGIGDVSPASLLTVGSGDLFQVDSTGNIVKINNVTTSFPSSQGSAGTILTNNGSGTLTWSAPAGISADALNFTDLSDSLLLDASTDIFSSGTNVLSVTNSGTGLSLRVNDDGTLTDATPVVVDASGNVGIGVAAPASKLDVAGSIRFSTTGSEKLIANNGGTTFLEYDSNGNVFLRAYDGGGTVRDIALQTGNPATTRLFVDETGLVGIGTASPTGNLSVSQTVAATGALKGIVYTGAVNTNQTLSTEIPSLTLTTAGRQWATGALTTQREVLITQPTYSFVGASTITDAATVGIAGAPIKSTNATITNTHGLLIQAGAVSTATNSYGITVNAQTGATNNYSAAFLGGNVGVGTTSPAGKVQVVTTSDTTPSTVTAWDARHLTVGATGSTGSGVGISYDQTNNRGYISAASPNNTWRDIIIGAGTANVGIGMTTAPAAKLTVSGGDILLDNGKKVYMASITNGAGYFFDGSSAWGLKAYNSGSNYYTDLEFDSTGGSGSNSRGIRLMDWNGSAVRLFVGDTGNVGIGNTNPGYLLHVGSSSVTDGTTVLRLEDANSTCSFTANTGAPTCGSDETLKKNITDLGGSLSKIDALRLVEYNWKTDAPGTTKQTGFVAQEVEKIFPKLVTEQKWIDGTNKKFLETAGLVPYLVGATQELSVQTKSNTTEISELKKENADMKAEISDLKTRLESLEQKLK